MLVKGQEGIQEMGHSEEASGLLVQLGRSGAIMCAEPAHISFQQVLDSGFVGLPRSGMG